MSNYLSWKPECIEKWFNLFRVIVKGFTVDVITLWAGEAKPHYTMKILGPEVSLKLTAPKTRQQQKNDRATVTYFSSSVMCVGTKMYLQKVVV